MRIVAFTLDFYVLSDKDVSILVTYSRHDFLLTLLEEKLHPDFDCAGVGISCGSVDHKGALRIYRTILHFVHMHDASCIRVMVQADINLSFLVGSSLTSLRIYLKNIRIIRTPTS